MPNRFKTPNYPTLPLDGTPPTVRSGDFGGVQAEDVHKYLDKNVSDPIVAKRSLPKPPNYPCLPPDSIRPPTVRSGDPSCVHPRDVGNHVDESVPSQSTESDAAAPSDVRPADFCGVQPEDIREYIEQNGPYHIEIPSNSTNASEAVATPTPQPESVEKSGLIAVLKEKYGIGDGIGHNKREDAGSCLFGIPIFGPCRPYKKHSLQKRDLDVRKEKYGVEHTKREAKKEEKKECLVGFPIFGRCIPTSKHPHAPTIIDNLVDRFGSKLTKREDNGNCFFGIPIFGRCKPYKKHDLEKRGLDAVE